MATALTSEVRSLKRRGDKTVVEVEVTGAVSKITESGMRNRARARALVASNVFDTVVNTVTDVAVGDIKRMTVITGAKKGEAKFTEPTTLGDLFMTRVYTVEVNTGD